MKKFFPVLVCPLALSFFACSDSNSGKTRSVSYPVMTCTELMYHPQNGWPEFVELKLTGKSIESMSAMNLRLDGAVEFSFPDEPLAENEIIVVTNDKFLFQTKYPNFSGRLFQWNSGFKLSNSGDVLEIKLDGPGDFDARFDNNPPWPNLADGNGSSLVYIGGNPAYASAWAASKTQNGNPGSEEDPYYEHSSVRINEIMPYHEGSESWIEFYNAASSDADIGGWKIVRADAEDSLRYIPSGTTVPAKGFLVLKTLLSESGEETPVSFVARGESVYLREAVNGILTGVESSLEFSAVPNGKSAGTIALSDSTMEQGTLLEPTPGSENSKALLGPVFISEVYYNPPDGDVEFLEIVNKGNSAVSLRKNLDSTILGWKVAGVGFEWADLATIAPGEVALLIPKTYTAADGYTSLSITVEEFRAKWNLPEMLQVFQYPGKLSNRGEKISIEEPSAIAYTLNADSLRTFYRVSDAILYSDDGLWPEEADGDGYSLNRVDFEISGHEPSNWIAAQPTPGF